MSAETTRPRRVTKAQLIQQLETIVAYVLPVYTFNGEPYVKLQHAQALQNAAKDALQGQVW